jgi:hypothetical protein
MSLIGKPPDVVHTDQLKWEDDVLIALLDGDDVLVIDPATGRHCLISGRQFGPREPPWPTARRQLQEAGFVARSLR